MRNHFLAVSLIVVIVASVPAMTWPDPASASTFKQPVNEKLGIGTTFGRWPDGVVSWVYNPTGKPAVFTSNAYFVGLVQDAMAELEGISGLTFVYMGNDSNAQFDTNDGVVVVGWTSLGGATAGQGGPSSSCSGQDVVDFGYCQYVDGSVKFDNDGSTVWDKGVTDFTERDFKGTAVHELFHLVGVGHSEVGQSIMFADPYTNLSVPREDDIDALQSLYGEPAVLSQSSIYLPPTAGASPLMDSFISLSDDDATEVTEIDGSEADTFAQLFWKVQGPFTDDLTFVATDPHGFYYQGRIIANDCPDGFICTQWASFAEMEALFTFPGVWTVYAIVNDELIATESVTVTTNPAFNQAPDSTLTHDTIYGPAPLTVKMTLDVTGDNEGDAVDATWHIPMVGEIALDSGNFPGSAGTDSRTVTFDTPGEYEIYIEVNDDWARYNPGSGSEAGPGFRTLYRRVVRVTKVSDDITTFSDVTGDAVPDLAGFVGGPKKPPRTAVYSGANGDVDSTVDYLSNKWRGIALGTVRDANQDGTADDPAVAVLADHDVSGKIVVETRKLADGTSLGKIFFRNASWRAIDIAVIDDTNGDGNTNDTSIAVLARQIVNGKIMVEIRSLGGGALVGKIEYLNDKWSPVAVAALDRSAQAPMGGLSPLIGVLAENNFNGKRYLQSRVLSNGNLDRNVKFVNSNWSLKDVTALHDANGDGANTDPAWQVLAYRDSKELLRVQSRLASNGSLDSNLTILNADWEGLRLDSAPDMNTNGSHEVAVSAIKRTSGKRRIHVKDYETKATIINVSP